MIASRRCCLSSDELHGCTEDVAGTLVGEEDDEAHFRLRNSGCELQFDWRGIGRTGSGAQLHQGADDGDVA